MGEIACTCTVQETGLTVTLRDHGSAFSPEDVPPPDTSTPLVERKPGGLGLFLIKKIMDEVYFQCDPRQGNTLVMVKYR